MRDMKVLCICYCFPPAPTAEAYVSAKTMGAIPNATVTVITLAPQFHKGHPDNSLEEYVERRFNKTLYMTNNWFPCLGKIPRLPLRPDRFVLLNRSVKKYTQNLNPSTFDVMVTRSQYHSVHGVGYALKKEYPEIPWVASFSDPWSGNIYEKAIPIASFWSRRLERRVLGSADALIFPSQEMKEFVAHQHNNSLIRCKSHVVPHSFDPSLYTKPSVRPASETIQIGMFGSFYGPRSPERFLQAIDIGVNQLSLKDFKIKIYGQRSKAFDHFLKQFRGAEKHVQHAGPINHSAALSEMEKFDILILCDASMDPPSIFLPSKLIDYLGAGRPIFAITPEGTSADLVRKLGGWSVSPDNPAVVASQLSKAFAAIKREGGVKINNDIVNQYTVEKIGARFRKVLELVSDR